MIQTLDLFAKTRDIVHGARRAPIYTPCAVNDEFGRMGCPKSVRLNLTPLKMEGTMAKGKGSCGCKTPPKGPKTVKVKSHPRRKPRKC